MMNHATSGSHSVVPLAVALAAVAVLSIAPFSGLPIFYVQQAFTLFFFIGLAQSWNILGGYTGYLSLGHAAFVGIGGYAVAILYFHFGWSPFLTFPASALAAGVLALIIGAICFRIRGSYFLIATMLVLFILQSLMVNLRTLTNGANGIDLPLFTFDFNLEAQIWYFCGLALVVLTSGIAHAIERSKFGLNLMAIREDEDVARTMGVRTTTARQQPLSLALRWPASWVPHTSIMLTLSSLLGRSTWNCRRRRSSWRSWAEAAPGWGRSLGQ